MRLSKTDLLHRFKPFSGHKSDRSPLPHQTKQLTGTDPDPDVRVPNVDVIARGTTHQCALPHEAYERPTAAAERLDRLEPINFPTQATQDPPPIQSQAVEDAQYEAWRKLAWSEIFSQPDISLEDLTPWRIRTAWRLVREMFRARGIIAQDQMLVDLDPTPPAHNPTSFDAIDTASTLNYDAWTTPEIINQHAIAKSTRQNERDGHLYASTYKVIQYAEQSIPDKFKPFRWVVSAATEENPTQAWHAVHFDGLPILPPSIPLPWLDPNNPERVLSGYDPNNPDHDPALHGYISILKHITNIFYLDLGTINDPNAGRYGIAGLLDPATIRFAFPSRIQIMAFESVLVDETLTLIIQNGKPFAREQLARHYGLQPIEINQLLKIAANKALHMVSNDIEEDRSVMILRLEEAAKRAKSNLDIRAEIAALKNIAIIQGLAKVEPQDMLKDFISVVRQASALPAHVPVDTTARPVESPTLPS